MIYKRVPHALTMGKHHIRGWTSGPEPPRINIYWVTPLGFPYTKCSCRAVKNISNKLHQCALNHNKLFGDFCRQIKSWKSRPNFFKFQFFLDPTCPSSTESFAEQTRGLSKYIVSNNKTAPKSLEFTECNRPFYRYGGHIELIRLREYYRMPRGHEHISFLFSSAFRGIFS